MEQTINCPKCGEVIPLAAAMGASLSAQLEQGREKLRLELAAANASELEAQRAAIQKEADEKKAAEVAAAIAENSKRVEEAERLKKEAEDKAKEQEEHNRRELQAAQEQAAKEKAEAEAKVREREEQIRKELQREHEQTDSMRLAAEQKARDMEQQLAQERETARQKEEAAKKELEEKEAAIRVELSRRLTEENAERLAQDRVRMAAEIRQQIESSAAIERAEQNQLVASLTKQIEDLRTEARSQQLTGEAQEIALEEALRMAFPGDVVHPVPKGFKGADCMLEVRTSDGLRAGSIIFESKRTKAWATEWIPKLKDNQREAGVEIAVLVSQAFPSDVKNRTAFVDGVWLTDFPSAIGMVMALRAGLVEVSRIRSMQQNASGKDAEVVAFITGVEFRQSIQAIAETFIAFQNELAAEKRAMEKTWKRREVTIKRALTATLKVHGSLQGMLGSTTIPDIDEKAALQLTA